MSIADFEQTIFEGLVVLFGNSLVAIAFFLLFLAVMCLKTKLRLEASLLVILPTIVGLTKDNLLPIWIKALFLIAIGVLWGIAMLRMTRSE